MKNLIKISILTSIFLTSIEARNLPSVNICEENIVNNIKNISSFYTKTKEKEFKSKIYNKKLNTKVEKLKSNIYYKLYDFVSLKEYLNIIINDKPQKIKRKTKPTIENEKKFINIMKPNILISLKLDKNKDIIKKYYQLAKKSERLQKDLFSYTFTNFLILSKLDFFKNEEQKNIFLENIIRDKKEDKIIKNFEKILNKEDLEIFESDKEKTKLKIKLSKELENCYFEKKLIGKINRKTSYQDIKLFNESIYFKDKEKEINNYEYAITKKGFNNIFLNYLYLKETNNPIKSIKYLELLYGLEKKPEYLKDLLIEEYMKAAEESTRIGKHINAWKLSVKGIKLIYTKKDFTEKDRKEAIKFKKILAKKANRIINILLQNKERENASKVDQITKNLLNKIIK
jgi:succinate dehydrogenase flavin-adding protein (antitoxin of CptAB toxin-antitoxin module)